MSQTSVSQSSIGNTFYLQFIRISVGLVYAWFGILKFFPSMGPAESLAKRTLDYLSLSLIPADFSYFLLAVMETVIGLCLISNRFVKVIIYVAIGHIIMTFSPIILLTSEVFRSFFIPTLVGQYILKNFVLLGAILLIKKSTDWK